MKLCPTCQRTYPDDAPDYCSNDGMRLVDEEAAGYDPEKTMLSSAMRTSEPEAPSAVQPPQPSAPPPPPQPQYFAPEEMPGNQPPPQPAPQWQPPQNQPVPPPAPVAQGAPQQAWSPAPPQPAQPWGTPYQGYAANAPFAPPTGGTSRALAIAALVTGACAATIMTLMVARSRDFFFGSLLTLSILGIGLGVTALILSLQKPARFGGIPLAIAGLALGTAGLVYYFTL